MFDRLEAAFQQVDAALDELDPDSMVGGQPAACLELLERHERRVAAARLAVTDRASTMNHWQRQGHDSFEDWLAATYGTSYGQARRQTRTAKKLAEGAEQTADALANGEISEDEAETIADAADENPSAERDLLDTAKNRGKSHRDLKKQAARAKAAGEDDTERARRFRRGRRAGWSIDDEGFWSLHGRFEPHVGAQMQNRLGAEVDRIFAAARRNGTREGHEQYRADAIANLIRGHTTDSPTTSPAAASADTGNGSPATKSASQTNENGTGRRTNGSSNGDRPTNGNDDRADSTDSGNTESSDISGAGPDDSNGPGPAGTGAVDSPNGQLDLGLTDRPDPNPDTTDTPTTTSDRRDPVSRMHREIIIDIDLETWRRRCVKPGETCEIRGLGPIPVEVAHQWAEDAFIKAVIRDGVDVKKVIHYGRNVPAEVRTALGIVEKNTCQVPGCDHLRIEYDHDITHADLGGCSTTNLRGLCVPHHRQRTHHGYELTGQPGDRRWLDPDGNVLFADQPDKTHQPTRAP